MAVNYIQVAESLKNDSKGLGFKKYVPRTSASNATGIGVGHFVSKNFDAISRGKNMASGNDLRVASEAFSSLKHPLPPDEGTSPAEIDFVFW